MKQNLIYIVSTLFLFCPISAVLSQTPQNPHSLNAYEAEAPLSYVIQQELNMEDKREHNVELPNLSFFKPLYWDDSIMILDSGTTCNKNLINSKLHSTNVVADKEYTIVYAYANTGRSDINGERTNTVYTMGKSKQIKTVTTSSVVQIGHSIFGCFQYSFQQGQENITIGLDTDYKIPESDENNNEHTYNFTLYNDVNDFPVNIDLKPHRPSNWSELVLVNNTMEKLPYDALIQEDQDQLLRLCLINEGTDVFEGDIEFNCSCKTFSHSLNWTNSTVTIPPGETQCFSSKIFSKKATVYDLEISYTYNDLMQCFPDKRISVYKPDHAPNLTPCPNDPLQVTRTDNTVEVSYCYENVSDHTINETTHTGIYLFDTTSMNAALNPVLQPFSTDSLQFQGTSPDELSGHERIEHSVTLKLLPEEIPDNFVTVLVVDKNHNVPESNEYDNTRAELTVDTKDRPARDTKFYRSWWWNKEHPGYGFSIDVEDTGEQQVMFMVHYCFDDSGEPTWLPAALHSTDGGKSFTGNIYKPTLKSEVGYVQLFPCNSTSLFISFQPTGDYTRFSFIGSLEKYLQQTGDEKWKDADGWWVPKSENASSGVGLFLENQGEDIFIGYFHYENNQTRWKVMGSTLPEEIQLGSGGDPNKYEAPIYSYRFLNHELQHESIQDETSFIFYDSTSSGFNYPNQASEPWKKYSPSEYYNYVNNQQ